MHWLTEKQTSLSISHQIFSSVSLWSFFPFSRVTESQKTKTNKSGFLNYVWCSLSTLEHFSLSTIVQTSKCVGIAWKQRDPGQAIVTCNSAYGLSFSGIVGQNCPILAKMWEQTLLQQSAVRLATTRLIYYKWIAYLTAYSSDVWFYNYSNNFLGFLATLSMHLSVDLTQARPLSKRLYIS